MAESAVLLVNLGSPDSTSVPDVRKYLRDFLSDERVLDAPTPIRWTILNLFILPRRPAQSAEAYERVWMKEGSPLVVVSKRQQELLQEKVDQPVYLAMRYGTPSIPEVLKKIVADGTKRLLLMPLYPHYAMSSYETVVVRVMEVMRELGPQVKVDLLQPFYNDPEYIDALVESAKPYLEEPYDKLLFSYHGVPERHIRKGDPSHAHCLCTADCCHSAHPAHATCYRHQCRRTTELVVDKLGLPEDKWFMSFQSRLGRDPWLTPFTDETLKRLAHEGVKRVKVICPSFITDCLETLEENAITNAEIFREEGGEELTLIPCLNESASLIDFLAKRVHAWQDEPLTVA